MGILSGYRLDIKTIFARQVTFMIDLSVMHLMVVNFLALIGLALTGFEFQGVGTIVSVTDPQAGTVLQGIYPIQGTVKAEQFNSYEVSFGYGDDLTDTWFLISQSNQPVQDGLLASWDTTQITDGAYRIRVLLKFKDGATQELIVSDLKVRNYTPLEPVQATQATVAASLITAAPTPTLVSAQIASTSTPFSTNPGSLSQADFQGALIKGAGISVGFFILFGFYAAFRKRPHRR